jgi:hypothetical protein
MVLELVPELPIELRMKSLVKVSGNGDNEDLGRCLIATKAEIPPTGFSLPLNLDEIGRRHI